MDPSIFYWTLNNENIKKTVPFVTFVMFNNNEKKLNFGYKMTCHTRLEN